MIGEDQARRRPTSRKKNKLFEAVVSGAYLNKKKEKRRRFTVQLNRIKPDLFQAKRNDGNDDMDKVTKNMTLGQKITTSVHLVSFFPYLLAGKLQDLL